MSRDPNYWGYDERYPGNQLPYVDTLKVLIIPNLATTMAAFRTGKIDVIDGLQLQDVQNHPENQPRRLAIRKSDICQYQRGYEGRQDPVIRTSG